jgi:DNA-binding NarL/FixJ family response regulator
MIRLLLVDDHPLVRSGLKLLLESNSDLKVIGEAANGIEAIDKAELLNPDLVLMDVRMPEMDGITACKIINQRFPNIKVLILSTFDDMDEVTRAMENNSTGYLLKDTNHIQLKQAISLAFNGYTQFSPGLFQKFGKNTNISSDVQTIPIELKKLTKREKMILCLIIDGHSNYEISEILSISEQTVKNYITSIFNNLNVKNRKEAAKFAKNYSAFLEG